MTLMLCEKEKPRRFDSEVPENDMSALIATATSSLKVSLSQ